MSQSEITIVKDNTFNTIHSAVNKMVGFIEPTYGPANNKVIIDKFAYRMVVDDGVQAARDFELPDPAENSIVKLVREVAVTTNDRSGDGTTGSLITLKGIINEVQKQTSFNGRAIELELKEGLKEAKEQLLAQAVMIDSHEDIKKVARVSFDNVHITDMIADLYFELGKDAIITIDKSPTMETTVQKTDGTQVNTGYISPYMVTNPERMETEFEKPHFLITDYRLTEASDITPVMNLMAKEQLKNLVVIAENVEQNALATMIVNLPHVVNPKTQKNGTFHSIAIPLPKVDDRTAYMEDLALLLGARVFSQEKGDKLGNVTVADLGTAKRVIVKQEETIIIDPQGNKGDVATSITSLRSAIEKENNSKKKKALEKRLARFTNTLAVISVGAPTENEQKALKYKVEDTVHSVKAALQGGVVRGSGLALANITTSSPILNEALKYPARQLRENMGLKGNIELSTDEAVNVVTGEKGHFLSVGVLDPAQVLLSGIESAVSIAGILLTSAGVLVEHQKEEK